VGCGGRNGQSNLKLIENCRRINATAPIHETVKGVIDLRHILEVNAYNAKRSMSAADEAGQIPISSATYAILQDRRVECGNSDCSEPVHEHSAACTENDHKHSAAHQHSRDLTDISTISIPLPLLSTPQRDRLEVLLRSLLWDGEVPASGEYEAITGLEVLRTKGLFAVSSSSDENEEKVSLHMVQGVKELYEIKALPITRGVTSHSVSGTLVLIGKGLSDSIRGAVQHTLVTV